MFFRETTFDAGVNLDELLEEGQSRTNFMLRFTISHPDVHTTIVGTLNPDHLQSNIKAFQKGPLSEKNILNQRAGLKLSELNLL